MDKLIISNTGISLNDIIRIFLYYKQKITIVVIVVGLIAGLFVYLVLDPIFLSTSTLRAVSKSGGLSSLLGASGGIPDIGDLGDLTAGSGGAKELALYENILGSRRCIEETIIKFKLNDDWEFKYMQDAIKNFRENVLEIKKDKIAGTMEIGVNDKYPVRAKEINEFLIFQLNKINTELNVLNASNNREFIQKRYDTAIADLTAVEDSLKIFQDIHGVAPDLYIKAATQAELQIETEIKSEEIKLDVLSKIVSPDQPEIKTQQEKIAALKRQLEVVKNSPSGSNLNLKGAPDIVLTFIRLQRNVEIQNKILTFIIPMLEQAKIEEKKEMPSVLVLDSPFVPEKKTKPKRVVLIGMAMMITFFLTLAFFILKLKFFQYRKLFLKEA